MNRSSTPPLEDDPVTEALRSCRSLESRLEHARRQREGGESPEADAILDEMDHAWLKLSDTEQSLLRAEGPRRAPTPGRSQGRGAVASPEPRALRRR